MKNKKKQSSVRNYSIIALIFALLACIATFFLGVTRGLVEMGVFKIANVDLLQRWLLVAIGLVILGLAAYAIIEPDRVRRFFTGRQARYGSNALIMTIAFLGILVVGNVLVYQNPGKPIDMTEDRSNTLSPELLNALKTLPEKVTATAFFSQNSDVDSAQKLLSNIKANSNGKFDYSFVDPNRSPEEAIGAGITGDGKILLKLGERKEIAASASETEILKALSRLLNPGNSVIYFLTGHGERDIEQGGESSMTQAKSTLENKNYTVKTLNLLVDNQVPKDANVVVVAGPLKPLSDNEIKLLTDYLAKGGSLIVMEDPSFVTKFGDAPDPLADMLAKDWGITFENDIVIDLNSPQPSTAVAAYYDRNHPITTNMNGLTTYFPLTRSLKASDSPKEGITLTKLVQTSERSWGETDFQALANGGQVGPSKDESKGPLTLAVAGENSATQGRVVVFGTSEFAMDQIFNTYGNGDMFVNSVDWNAKQEQGIGVTPKTPTERTFKAPGQLQWIAILLGSIFVIPGLVILGGVSTWLARRRQG